MHLTILNDKQLFKSLTFEDSAEMSRFESVLCGVLCPVRLSRFDTNHVIR